MGEEEEEPGICNSTTKKTLYLSAGKYFISKKDRQGYLLRVCKYAKYGVVYANVFKMTPLRLQGSHFDSQTVAT